MLKKLDQNLALEKLQNSAALKIVFLVSVDPVVTMTAPCRESINNQFYNFGMK